MQLFCAFARNPTKDSNLELERTADRPDALETVTKSLEEHLLNAKSRASYCSLVREMSRLSLRQLLLKDGMVLPMSRQSILDWTYKVSKWQASPSTVRIYAVPICRTQTCPALG